MAKIATKTAPNKYCAGIDVSKEELAVCFSQADFQQRISAKGSRKFENSLRGWKSLQNWVGRFCKHNGVPFSIVMEATGVYYEGCAYHFKEQGFSVSVVLPNRSKNYARSLNVKSKNDAVDARVLAQMGLERALPEWKGMSATMLTLKRLCRERAALNEMRTVVSNQLHAHVHSHCPQKTIEQRLRQHLAFLDKQLIAIARQIEKTCAQDAELQKKVDNICTLKGLALLTVVTVIAETNAFDLIENKGQLVSYAGYDVVENQSGSSLRRKTRISKKGNSHIRRALYFPALSAARHEPKLKALYERVNAKKPQCKMVGAVAVQRKLLVLIYTLFKKNQPYDPNYENNKAA